MVGEYIEGKVVREVTGNSCYGGFKTLASSRKNIKHGLTYDPVEGGDMFLRNIDRLSADYATLYCHVLRMGSVTNNSTWVRIEYRIYSLWRFTAAIQVTIPANTLALSASLIPLTELHCTDISLRGH
jgi:hypothetical protein